MRALIVDDSRPVRMILGRMLRSRGYSVCEAANGKEALNQLAKEGAVDLALVDWNMPEMNGLELIRVLRAHPLLKRMPVLMVTTETEAEQVAAALAAGANEYLMKPFTDETLGAKLDLVLAGGSL